jgi:acetyl-CoA synthetase
MSEQHIYPVTEKAKAQSHLSLDEYLSLYQQSIDDPDTFWANQANRFLDWDQAFSKVYQGDMKAGKFEWFSDGKLNVSTNCIDRHLPERADQIAIIWEGDEPGTDRAITYQELHDHVCEMANVLKQRGVKKGDRVCIYMPMIPEAAFAMLACSRIGAVHSVVFGGFSPEALKDRILDSDCQTVITTDEGMRGGRSVPLKDNADKALNSCPNVHTVLVVQRTGNNINWHEGRDIWYHEAIKDVSSECEPEPMGSEDTLFILYTSGSTGKPKGVLHTTAGYLLQAAMTHHYVFDYHDGDIYWCTADVGWVTGHSYIVYGPLANGATTLMFEGVPTYPDASRMWQIVDKYQVNSFYTAPTALRALMAQGNEPLHNTSRDSLRILGTVGEPINPEAWEWYYHQVGKGQCPIMDTWWQTETGGLMITPILASQILPCHFSESNLPWLILKAIFWKEPFQAISLSLKAGLARFAPSMVTINAV